MNNFQTQYQKEILPKMQDEFGIKNILAVPRLEKIVLSVGAGDAKDDKSVIEKVVVNLGALAGQKPVVTKAKKSVSNFKLAKGQAIGAMVTLRGERMYNFLEKLIRIVLPKVRDFRGIPGDSFDAQGNYSLGLREQSIFPEIDFKNADKNRGLGVSIITTAKNKDQGKRLLELFGMPFRKEL